MASGPWHYEKAECLLDEAALTDDTDLQPYLVWAANTHAMLALAAATSLGPHEYPTYSRSTDSGWFAVAGPQNDPPTSAGLWWLDDGGESPEPDLYLAYVAAIRAGESQFRDANPTTRIAVLGWQLIDEQDHDSGSELVVNGQRTGIVVRSVRPKDGA